MITLRGYQEKAVDGVRVEYGKGKNRVVLVMPTGAGKTVVFSHITRITASNGKRILVLAHRKELLTQCGDKLKKNDVDFGYLNPSFTPSPLFKVQVGTMQTVVKRMVKMNFIPDLIIVDECHRAMGKTYQDILRFYPKARVLGVTATPIRGDGKPLGEFFDAMVVGPNIKELIAMGALVAPRTFGPEKYLDFSSVAMVKQEDGSYDYDKKGLEKIVNTKEVTGDAIERYNSICPGVPAVAFCVSIQHAVDTARDFCAAGWKFRAIHGNSEKHPMSDREREDILRDLKDGRIHGITSVDLVTEGFDAPNLQCAIMLRKTLSEGLYLQMGGRVLRSHPGKSQAFILDHVGCAMIHGTVTFVRNWTLDTAYVKKKRNKDKEPPIRTSQCPSCYLIHEPAPVCPDCGHVYKSAYVPPAIKRGTLVEITEDQEQFINFLKDMPTTPQEIKAVIAQAQTFEDLLTAQRKFGFDSGWAKGIWAARNKKARIV